MTTPWVHPTIGAIEPLPRGLQPAKVWKHFYDRAQHWERLCGRDVGAMRYEAEAVVGVRRDEHAELPQMNGKRWRRVGELSAVHHDLAYGPVYMTGIAAAEALWTAVPDTERRHRVLTPEAVFVVVQCNDWNWVVTAYRPLPPTRGVDWDEADIRRYATEYFRRQTSMHADHLARTTSESLRRVTTVVPRSVNDVWWLASAIGYGRLLANRAEVADTLPTAEAVLGATSPELVAELARELDWEGCLRRLAAGLKDERSEEIEAILSVAETLLAVAGVVGAEAATEGFCVEAEALLAWMPPAWEHLGECAASRQEALGASEHPVVRFWSMVEDATLAAMMRELVPAAPTASPLVTELVAATARWRTWRHRLTQVAQAPSELAAWVASSLGTIRVEHPIPAMGETGRPAGVLDVRGRPASEAPHFRLFVVDEAHPDGREVTRDFGSGDEPLWHMDPGDQAALIILIASTTLVGGDDLSSVLAEAENRDDVAVGAKEVSRPR